MKFTQTGRVFYPSHPISFDDNANILFGGKL